MATRILLSRVLGSPLRGKIDGRRHYGVLCSTLSAVRPGTVVELDFKEVEDISASWIAAALASLPAWTSRPECDLYPVVTGFGPDEKKWTDEFELVADRADVVFLLRDERFASQVRMIGHLDRALLDTLRAVREHNEVTGARLKRLYPGEPIGATGWSNRLKELHTKRLLRRATCGREQIYTVALEVDLDGASSPRIADHELPAQDAAGGPGLSAAHSV